MRKYVLVHKGQITVQPHEAAESVRIAGFEQVAKRYGVGVSTLRKYLHAEGFRFSRKTSWQVERLPGMGEADDGIHARDVRPGLEGAVQAASAGADEPTGEGGGLGLVEADGVSAGHQPVGVGATSPE